MKVYSLPKIKSLGVDTSMPKSPSVDTVTAKSPGVDTTTARHGYSDASFLYIGFYHQKVRNMENLRGKICAFVQVKGEVIHMSPS